MDYEMIAMCGAYCGVCEWKEAFHCKGCKKSQGKMFWGECEKVKCCISKGIEHCGFCSEVPCQMLMDLFHDSEHGDNGARLENLHNWKNQNYVFKKLR